MYKEIVLDNHLTVIYECLSHLKSVSFGVWIGTGSRNESLENNGVSHFIEHMVFKGTQKRSAKEIACEMDRIGGQINAFTGKDCTCFYAKTLDSDLETAMDILSDMLFNSVFDPSHIETEKKVVLEEINMYEDDPEELVHDLLTEEIWSEGPLGYPILGTQKSLDRINRDTILDYMSVHYIPDNCIISVVGNFEEQKLLDLIKQYFGMWKSLSYCRYSPDRPRFKSNFLIKEKDTEQTHICLGFSGIRMSDDRIFPLMALNNIIGGGMSSRLFQRIREDLGLVYSIYSFPTAFRDVGMFSIYAAANPEMTPQVVDLIHKELKDIVKFGISDVELTRSKNQLKGNFILGLDSTSGRMTSIGKSKLITGFVRTPEEVLECIEGITMESVMNLAEGVFDRGGAGGVILGGASNDIRILEPFAKS